MGSGRARLPPSRVFRITFGSAGASPSRICLNVVDLQRRMKRKKAKESNLTEKYLSGELDEVDIDAQERFGARSKHFEAGKILKTALLRAEQQSDGEVQSLPLGDIIQVFSLYSDVEVSGKLYQCVVRKTLSKLADS